MSEAKKFEQCLNILILLSRLDEEENETDQADKLREVMYDLWMDLSRENKELISKVSGALK